MCPQTLVVKGELQYLEPAKIKLLTYLLLKVQTRPCLAGSRLWWVRTGLGVLAHVSSSLGYRLSPACSLCNVLCGPQERGQARLCYPITWTCSCAFKAIDRQGPGRRDPMGCEGPQDLSLDFSWRCAPCLLSRLEAARLSSMNSVKTWKGPPFLFSYLVSHSLKFNLIFLNIPLRQFHLRMEWLWLA